MFKLGDLTHFRRGGVRSGLGQLSKEIYEPDQKILFVSLNFGENIALAFLKTA